MRDEICTRACETLQAIANPSRLRILCLLSEGEQSVGHIAAGVGLSPAHVSAHLRVLYDRGVVTRRREWRRVYYGLANDFLVEFLDLAARLAEPGSPQEGDEA